MDARVLKAAHGALLMRWRWPALARALKLTIYFDHKQIPYTLVASPTWYDVGQIQSSSWGPAWIIFRSSGSLINLHWNHGTEGLSNDDFPSSDFNAIIIWGCLDFFEDSTALARLRKVFPNTIRCHSMPPGPCLLDGPFGMGTPDLASGRVLQSLIFIWWIFHRLASNNPGPLQKWGLETFVAGKNGHWI